MFNSIWRVFRFQRAITENLANFQRSHVRLTSAQPPITQKYIAQIASMLGHKVSYSDLRAAVFYSAGLEESASNVDSFDEAFGELLWSELMLADPLANEPAFCFLPGRTLNRFYQSISSADKARLHMRLAHLLEDQGKDPARLAPETIGAQYLFASRFAEDKDSRARILQRAIHWWQRTALIAMRGLALPEAIRSLKRCLRLVSKLERNEENLKTELQLILDLASASELHSGIASPLVLKIYDKARKLAEQVSETSLVFRTQWTFWFFAYLKGNLLQAKNLAEGLMRTDAYKQIRECQLEAQHAMWDTLFHLGQLGTACCLHALGINVFRKMSGIDRSRGYAGHAASACCLSKGALLWWLTGFVDQSVQVSQDAIAEAKALEHSNSCTHAFCDAAFLHLLRREPDKVREYARLALEYAKKHGVETRLIQCAMLLSAGELLFDPRQEAIADLQQNLRRWQLIGSRIFETFWLSCVAEAYLRIDQPDDGLTFIERAHKVAQETGEKFYIPEIHRLWGELLIAKSKRNTVTAKKKFWTSVEHARKSGARTLELRTLVSLSKHIGDSGRAALRSRLWRPATIRFMRDSRQRI